MYVSDARVMLDAARMLRTASRLVVKAAGLGQEKEVVATLERARSEMAAADARIKSYCFPYKKEV